MFRLSKKWFIFIVIVLAVSAAKGGGVALEGARVGEWTMDYTAATKLAKEKKLPLLLNFTGSDWCGWCKLMDRSVFAKPDWQSYAKQNMILVTLDFPKNKSIVPQKYVQRNYDLQSRFGVRGYPTYIILDEDGQTVLGQLGAGKEKTPQSFIAEVEDIVQFRKTALAKKESKLNNAQLKKFREKVAAYQAAKSELDNWLKTGPTRTQENLNIYQAHLTKISQLKEDLAGF